DGGGIHFVQELIGPGLIPRDNTIGVGRAVMVDVVDCLPDPIHHPNVENVVIVLSEPILLRGPLEYGVRSAEFRIASASASARNWTFFSPRRCASAGRKAPATLRSTSRVSIALQTAGRWTLAFSAIASAIFKSASASTYRSEERR